MRLLWHPLAEEELNDVAAFYMERGGPALAGAFLDEAERVADVVRARPAGGRVQS